jgi:putative FmdB family regulatory protein
MPIYEFECGKCGAVYERVMKVDERYDVLECPSCGATKPKKLVTAFRTHGWSEFLDKMEKKISPHKFK